MSQCLDSFGSFEQFAERAIEAGRTSDPGFFTVVKLMRALNVAVEDLLSVVEAGDHAKDRGA
jgi:hypothetical protein